jgi:hypothetical protein
MITTWFHYSSHPVQRERLVTRKQSPAGPYAAYSKPEGLWITDESEYNWPAWCLGENFGLYGLTNRHAVDIDMSRVHLMQTVAEVREFAARFGVEDKASEEYMRRNGINWQKAESFYDGVIIAPYLWEIRLDHALSWYYGWDCSSGCIWDAGAIRDVRLLDVTTVEALEAVYEARRAAEQQEYEAAREPKQIASG